MFRCSLWIHSKTFSHSHGHIPLPEVLARAIASAIDTLATAPPRSDFLICSFTSQPNMDGPDSADALQEAWAYADNRNNWSSADQQACREVILAFKSEVNATMGHARCCERTTLPLQKINCEIAEYLKLQAKSPTISTDANLSRSPYSYLPIQTMSSKCKQYLGIIMSCLMIWASESAPYKGMRMADVIFSLEDLLLFNAVREPSSRMFFGRFRRAITRDESCRAVPTSKDIWRSFVRWRRDMNLFDDSTVDDTTQGVEAASAKELDILVKAGELPLMSLARSCLAYKSFALSSRIHMRFNYTDLVSLLGDTAFQNIIPRYQHR